MGLFRKTEKEKNISGLRDKIQALNDLREIYAGTRTSCTELYNELSSPSYEDKLVPISFKGHTIYLPTSYLLNVIGFADETAISSIKILDKRIKECEYQINNIE